MEKSEQKKRVAIAYLRTSSSTNVGPEKDSDKRQRQAIEIYASAAGFEIAREYYDAGVSGTLVMEDRPEGLKMMNYIKSNHVDAIIVENAGRFARDERAQLEGRDFLKEQGVELIPADMPDCFTNESPSKKFMRRVMEAYVIMDKESLVERMRVARDRQRKKKGRCEGKKPAPPEAIAMAVKLRKQGLSLRAISAKMAEAGHFVMLKGEPTDRPYTAASVKYMIENLSEGVLSDEI